MLKGATKEMPGITGFFGLHSNHKKGIATLNKMSESLFHQPFYKRDELFVQDSIYASRVYNNVISTDSQPAINQQVYVWVDGEIYHPAKSGIHGKKVSDAFFLSSLYLKDNDFRFLENMDGIFSAVIYDQRQQQLHFVTDRYGLRFLYYLQQDDKLAWASEAKAMFALDWFEPKINPKAVHDFFTKSFLTGQKSWFNNLELFPPASIVTWNISRKKFSRRRTYWHWNQVKPLPEKADERAIVEELGSLFRKAVKKRVYSQEHIGVTLSGGLDSRSLLAAMPKSDKPVHAFTFGKPGCDDIRLASQACQIDGTIHHIAHMTAKNWMEKRIEGIWWTDGQMNLVHMHALVFFPEIRNYFNINLNGFLGDAILGGSYLQDKRVTFEKKVNNRGRRLIHESTRLNKVLGVNSRLPFFDYELMNFTLSIPVSLRKHSFIYNKMLLNEFPEYFKFIPWQRTGLTINTSRAGIVKRALIVRLRHMALQFYKKMGGNIENRKRNYHNYSSWLRKYSTFIDEILQNPVAIYPEFISRDQVLNDWNDHLNGQNKFDTICLYLTFEFFLQQVFENKYRPDIYNSSPITGIR